MRNNNVVRKAKRLAGRICFPYRPYMIQKKCVFIHIPKAAGSSIIMALNGDKTPRDHLTWNVYFSANPKRFQRYFKFAFVRNPYDRAYSAYRYLANGGNKASDLPLSNDIKKYGSFESFVVSGLGEGSYRNHLLFQPQANFVLGSDEKPVVDFLGFYERIEEDFSIVANRLGVNNSITHENKSTGNTLTEKQYSEISRNKQAEDVLRELYKQDCRAFGYQL